MNITRQDKITNKPTTYGDLKLFDLFRFKCSVPEAIGIKVKDGHIWLTDGYLHDAQSHEEVILIDHELIIKGDI